VPTVFEWKGWKFLFYSTDVIEPPHVHARKGRKELKVWVADLRVARNQRCTPQEVSAVVGIVRERRREIMEAWDEHFGDR
jgi:hypothetical protein